MKISAPAAAFAAQQQRLQEEREAQAAAAEEEEVVAEAEEEDLEGEAEERQEDAEEDAEEDLEEDPQPVPASQLPPVEPVAASPPPVAASPPSPPPVAAPPPQPVTSIPLQPVIPVLANKKPPIFIKPAAAPAPTQAAAPPAGGNVEEKERLDAAVAAAIAAVKGVTDMPPTMQTDVALPPHAAMLEDEEDEDVSEGASEGPAYMQAVPPPVQPVAQVPMPAGQAPQPSTGSYSFQMDGAEAEVEETADGTVVYRFNHQAVVTLRPPSRG